MIKFLIYKPIAVLMTALAVLILGLLAMGNIPISLMPDIDIPEITVQISADNMSAREMEDAIIKPLRTSLVQVSHLDDIKSQTENGNAIIKMHFTHGTNIDYSFIEVNEKIDRAMGNLPREVERPRVIKSSATDIPVFYLNLSLKEQDATKENGDLSQEFIDFNRFVNQVVRKRIEQIPEVAMVDVNGILSPEILIIPNRERIMALGLDLPEIESAITRQDVEIGSIVVKDNQYQYSLRLGSSLNNIRELENIYLNQGNRLFQVKDLAEVTEQPGKRRGLVLFNDKEAVSMAIIKQGDERMGDLKESLNRTVFQMEKDYPEFSFSVVRDQTKLLDYTISNLGQSLLWGISLAFLVMFFFLKDLRSPLLIGISVPISLIVSLLFFYLLDISVNIISLSGLILGTGLMIDNAIIVIDNIAQYREKGYSLPEACVQATNEVSKPMLSSVLTTCAVFIPLIFLSGLAGAIFYDQALAISIGLFVSLLVSLTLLPVLYRLFHLRGNKTSGDRFLKKINSLNYAGLYERGFRASMKKQPLMLSIFGSLILVSIFLFFTLPRQQMPRLTSTETMMEINWNEPLNVEENKKRMLQLTETIKEGLDNYNAQVGQQQFLLDNKAVTRTSESSVYLQAKTPEDLGKIKEKLSAALRDTYPDAVMEFGEVDNIFNLIFSGSKPPLTARLRQVGSRGNNEHEELEQVWGKLQEGLAGINLTPIAWEDQISLLANAEKMNLYGVSPGQLNTALKSAFNEKEIFSIMDNEDFVPVILGDEEKTIAEVLDHTLLRANDSTYYNVNQFLTRQKARGLQQITAGKGGEYYPVDLMISDAQEEEVTGEIKRIVSETPGYDVNFSGSLFEDRELINQLMIVLAITLALLYFILASQFESLTLPFVILAEIPISMAGAFLFLYIFDMSLNLMSMIGIVVMCGIIINDSILKIDTIIQLQRRGHSLMKALLVAGQRRLKPILMTSITTILALLPVLLTGGLGGELQAPLAVALIGGMILGTLVSLYFIPLFYYHLVKKKSYAR